MTGMTQSARQTADARSERATVGRACSGSSSPSRLSTSASSALPWPPPCPPPTRNAPIPASSPRNPTSAAPNTMNGNGTPKKKIPTKAAAASTTIMEFWSARRADPHARLEHDGQDRGFEPEEQRLDDRHAAPPGVDVAQGHDRQNAGHDEQPAGDDPAAGAMHQPADIGRELLR